MNYPADSSRARLIWVGTGIVLMSLALVVKAATVQLKGDASFPEWALRQNEIRITIPATRGGIIDRNGTELALSVPADSIWANPAMIEKPRATAKQLAKILKGDEKELFQKLSSGKSFVWLARQVDHASADKVKALDIRGIDFIEERKRTYPHGTLAGPVLGFTGIDANGLAGLEYSFDSILRGKERVVMGERDAKGRFFQIGEKDINMSADGDSVYVTLDSRIQEIAERELKNGIEKTKAKGGTAIVMDPWTGDVLAMANYPEFDPNHYRDYAPDRWRNDAIGSVWEPGSTMKSFLLAGALEEGAVSPSTLINCEGGRFPFMDRVFRDDHPHTVIPASDVLKFSSNIGAIKIAQRLGKKTHLDYMHRFGFGSRSEIDLPGEEKGILEPTDRMRDVQWATVAFGQGVSVTPLQITRAMAAIANGGRLPRPRLMKSVRNAAGLAVVESQPPQLERVISEKTARTLTEILETVVESDGTGAQASVQGYSIAGKTGTAQKHEDGKRGYSRARIGSFVGFVPSRDPKLVIFVSIDEPQGIVYGGLTAGPVFSAVAEQTLSILAVTPTVGSLPQLLSKTSAVVPAAFHGTAGSLPVRRMAVREPVPQDDGIDRLPDFTGMTMRRVLAWGRERGVEFDFRGTGVVTDQKPVWGTPVENAGKVVVDLRPPP